MYEYMTAACKCGEPRTCCSAGYHSPYDARRPAVMYRGPASFVSASFVSASEPRYAYESRPCDHVCFKGVWQSPTKCPDGDRCRRAHTVNERRFHPESYRHALCARWRDSTEDAVGRRQQRSKKSDASPSSSSPPTCGWGIACSLAHGSHQLRKVTAWRPLPPPKTVGLKISAPASTSVAVASSSSSSSSSPPSFRPASTPTSVPSVPRSRSLSPPESPPSPESPSPPSPPESPTISASDTILPRLSEFGYGVVPPPSSPVVITAPSPPPPQSPPPPEWTKRDVSFRDWVAASTWLPAYAPEVDDVAPPTELTGDASSDVLLPYATRLCGTCRDFFSREPLQQQQQQQPRYATVACLECATVMCRACADLLHRSPSLTTPSLFSTHVRVTCATDPAQRHLEPLAAPLAAPRRYCATCVEPATVVCLDCCVGDVGQRISPTGGSDVDGKNARGCLHCRSCSDRLHAQAAASVAAPHSTRSRPRRLSPMDHRRHTRIVIARMPSDTRRLASPGSAPSLSSLLPSSLSFSGPTSTHVLSPVAAPWCEFRVARFSPRDFWSFSWLPPKGVDVALSLAKPLVA